MSAQGVLWVAFHVIVLGVLAFDLGVIARKTHTPSAREAGGLSALWVLLSFLFGAAVWSWRGHEAGLAFLTGYLLEKLLSVDNMFVFLAIFTTFGVPSHLQPRVLKWGILGALVMRAICIATGAALLQRFGWVVYIFGGLILWTGIRMLRARRQKTADLGLPRFFYVLRRRIPTVERDGEETFTSRRGRMLVATPLLWALIAVEMADLVFAIDSIPAVFAITTDPFIVYTSNIFAVLGLRAMYFLLAGAVDRLRHLHFGLGIVLMFVGLKMLASGVYDVPVAVSLALIAAILSAAVVGSLFAHDARAEAGVSNRV